ncbi:uridine kinase [Streptomyces thermolineatus]|uniref:Uridine kinase n=1 Tax=Streptomyces thermolineatus TaxID=44033 RepID=A0ABN3MSA8_9ACTN
MNPPHPHLLAHVVLLTGPSGSGKSVLAEHTGLPVLRLDDFYKEAGDPTLPRLPGGEVDWDSPLSWDAEAAAAAVAELASTGRTRVPVYDIATSSRTGEAEVVLDGAPVFVAEGIFAAEIAGRCREAGVPADTLCLRGKPFTTFRRRLVRDLREGRKPVLFLLRRGWALLRAEERVVRRQVELGATVCDRRLALARIGTAAGGAAAADVGAVDAGTSAWTAVGARGSVAPAPLAVGATDG